jgi:hypothetical protein
MGDSAATPSALGGSLSQSLADPEHERRLLREAGLCGYPTKSGRRCRAPWIESTSSCAMGHGLSPEEVSRLRRQASQAAHAVEAKVESWARRIDWSTADGVLDTLEMAAEMVMRRLLSPQQASAIAQLAGVRLRPVQKPTDDAKALVVEVQRFGDNSHGESPA